MNFNLYDLLPERVSDETAFYLVEFFMRIAMELDLHYFAQARRYRDDNTPLQPLQDKINSDNSF